MYIYAVHIYCLYCYIVFVSLYQKNKNNNTFIGLKEFALCFTAITIKGKITKLFQVSSPKNQYR